MDYNPLRGGQLSSGAGAGYFCTPKMLAHSQNSTPLYIRHIPRYPEKAEPQEPIEESEDKENHEK